MNPTEQYQHPKLQGNELMKFLINTDGLVPYNDSLATNGASGHILITPDRNKRLETLPIDTEFTNAIVNNLWMSPRLSRELTEDEKVKYKKTYESRAKDFSSRVAGKPFVDIGAGATANGYILACLGGASAYYGIEPFHYERLVREINDFIKTNKSSDNPLPEIPYLCIAEDVRKAIERFPDNSVSIMSCGIDSIILGDISGGDDRRLVENVGQKLSSDGLYISTRTDFIRPDDLVEFELKHKLETSGFGLFIKPASST
jgi:hypothetical protein